MPPAARISDLHTCPLVDGVKPHVGGPIMKGCPTVIVGGFPQARVGDMVTCVGPPDMVAKGSMGVMVGGQPAARMGDLTAHGGVIVKGCPTVIIGEVAGDAGAKGLGGKLIARMGLEGAAADMAAAAKAMVAAAKAGAPFAEQCMK